MALFETWDMENDPWWWLVEEDDLLTVDENRQPEPELSAKLRKVNRKCITNSEALLFSQVFYCNGDFDDSLSYAIQAGPSFDVSQNSDYVNALLAKAVDEYAILKSKAQTVDPGLENLIERMLESIKKL